MKTKVSMDGGDGKKIKENKWNCSHQQSEDDDFTVMK